MKRIKLGEIFCLARFVDRLLVDRPTKESFATGKGFDNPSAEFTALVVWLLKILNH